MKDLPYYVASVAGCVCCLAPVLLDVARPIAGTLSLVGLTLVGFSFGWRANQKKGGE